MPSLTATLRRPRLRRLIAAYVVSGLGDWCGEIALSALVYAGTGSVVAVTALWILGRVVPAVLAPPLVARLAARRAAVPALYACETVAFGALAALAAAGAPLVAVLALAVVDGVAALAARALTKAAIVAAAGEGELLAAANRLLNTSSAASMAVGPALAGAAVAVAGPAVALVADGASFAVAALLLLRFAPASAGGAEPSARPRISIGAAVARVRVAGRVPRLLAADAATCLCFSVVLPVELVYVTGTLGGSAGDFGLVLAAWGAGGVLGGLALGPLARVDAGSVLLAAFLLMVAGYLGMGSASTVAACVACSLLGGIGNGMEGSALLTAVQRATPGDLQPHVNALVEASRCAVPGVGFALGGFVAAAASPRATYAVAGLGALLVVVALARTIASAARQANVQPSPA